ncbi:MAG: tRNA (adenosine(37)-N6)-dimethylallyltransferase MiaA [Bacteroidaceae bacterium]|nr:tRNA (adenosine(37)-N6)-dimethylallyltransferase MiaA [Bacteroidaceae bacterium]
MRKERLITILGPTASGKTSVAARLAARLGDAEIISADSRQVYRGMDVGTGKDLSDYVVDGHAVPYHLIDICEAGERYNLFRYQQDFWDAYNDIVEDGRRPILCGGTGLYIESVLQGYRMVPVPENPALRDNLRGKTLDELADMLAQYKVLHNTTDIDTPQRAIRAIEIQEYYRLHHIDVREIPRVESLTVGLYLEREERRRRISLRLRRRLEEEHMVDEVARLLQRVTPEDLMYYGLEYKFVTLYCLGRLSYSEMYSQLEIAIHQFAKRQMTWFRGMERRGIPIHWIDASQRADEQVEELMGLVKG